MTAVEAELRARGRVETVLTERGGHAAELAGEASRACERLYVLAGDGGFNEAVNGIDADVAVGFLPGGASSVLPRALGLPRDPVACARALARSQEIRRITLGRVRFSPTTPPPDPQDRGRRFTFSAGLGLDAELVREVDRLGRGGGRRARDAAFVWSLASILAARRGRMDARMTVLGRGRAAFALVANCDPYTYAGRMPVHVAPEARFELGLDLVAPERLRPAQLPRLAWWALARPGGQLRSPDVVYVHDADELRIECDEPTPLQADGEDLGDVDGASFEAEREALRVVVSGRTSP